MDSVGLSRLKEKEKDRLKAEGTIIAKRETADETSTKQRKRVSFTIMGPNNKDNGTSNSINRVKGFSRNCKKCCNDVIVEERTNNINTNHEPIVEQQRGAKRPSNNDLSHTCSKDSNDKHTNGDNDIDMERKIPVLMAEPMPIGIMRVPTRFSSSSPSSSLKNASQQQQQQQQPIVRFKYSKLVNALKRSNETRGLIEKIVKKIKRNNNNSSALSSSRSTSSSSSSPAPTTCMNNNDNEEEFLRCSVRRKICAEFTKAMMAQTLPSTMISYVENNMMIFNSNNNNNDNSIMMMMMNRRRRCAMMGSGGQGRTRIVHRILIDQHKRILGDNNNERKDNNTTTTTTTTKIPPATGKKNTKRNDK
jgi:hypothetical protein